VLLSNICYSRLNKGDILLRKYLTLVSLSVFLAANVASADSVKFALPMEREMCKNESFMAYVRDMAFIENDPASLTVTFFDIKNKCVTVLHTKKKCDNSDGACHVIKDEVESGTVFSVYASRADNGKKYNVGRVHEMESTETDYSKYQAVRDGNALDSQPPMSK